MGIAKRLRDEQRQKALKIAIEAGVLKPCEFHEDIILEGGADIEDAYRLGNAKFTRGEFVDIFQDRREMTDTIKSLVEEHYAAECSTCAKWRNE